MKRKWSARDAVYKMASTGRTVEMWKDEGKEDSEGRRECPKMYRSMNGVAFVELS